MVRSKSPPSRPLAGSQLHFCTAAPAQARCWDQAASTAGGIDEGLGGGRGGYEGARLRQPPHLAKTGRVYADGAACGNTVVEDIVGRGIPVAREEAGGGRRLLFHGSIPLARIAVRWELLEL